MFLPESEPLLYAHLVEGVLPLMGWRSLGLVPAPFLNSDFPSLLHKVTSPSPASRSLLRCRSQGPPSQAQVGQLRKVHSSPRDPQGQGHKRRVVSRIV